MRVLILGGTAEARHLASRLVGLGHEVITSLAGRTSDPILPEGDVRVGKFGGIAGLIAYLDAAEIDRLVDATHPYAETISANAVAAAHQGGVPLVRLVRPGWVEPAGAHWQRVGTIGAAARALPAGSTVLLTTGHEGLATVLERNDCRFVVRLIQRPEIVLPHHATLLLTRPPYELDDELSLFERQGISHLVTKNSGGSQTSAKLDAARRTGATVIMIDRPALPPAREVASVPEAVAALGLDGAAAD